LCSQPSGKKRRDARILGTGENTKKAHEQGGVSVLDRTRGHVLLRSIALASTRKAGRRAKIRKKKFCRKPRKKKKRPRGKNKANSIVRPKSGGGRKIIAGAIA